MYTSIVLTALMASFVTAQNASTFNPSSVDLTTRNQWCSGELANCPRLCGGPDFTKSNTCAGATLNYQCTCSNGTSPASIDEYLDTLPNHICQQTFAQCKKENPGSTSCTTCGTLQATSVPTSTKAAVMASSSATEATGTSTAASGPSTSNAAIRGGFGMGALAGGVVAALMI